MNTIGIVVQSDEDSFSYSMFGIPHKFNSRYLIIYTCVN